MDYTVDIEKLNPGDTIEIRRGDEYHYGRLFGDDEGLFLAGTNYYITPELLSTFEVNVVEKRRVKA